MCEKHKTETRVSERHKPGFRVWQNELVSPGPGFQSLPSTGTGCSVGGAKRVVGVLSLLSSNPGFKRHSFIHSLKLY